MRSVRCLAACTALLAGCTVGPDFHPPAASQDAPSSWGTQRTDVASRTDPAPLDPHWWNSFGDPLLSSLVARVATQNLDLQAAAERVLQGRAEREVAASQGLPHIDERSFYQRRRDSLRGDPISLVTPAPGAPVEFDVFQNGLSSSWELDLFGRVRRRVEAANADTQAAIEDRRGIALAAIADLAQDYLQLRGVQAQRVIAEGSLALARQDVALVDRRIADGVATTLDRAQAAAQQATVAATLSPLRTQEVALINAIGLLLGEPPRAMEAELRAPAAQPGVPPVVPIGLPATLVRRRPDVRQAEARLHAATAQTGVAVAEFYPDVTLTGDFGLQGLRLKDAFSLYARQFQVGPSVSIPIFQGGRLRGTLRLRQSQQREAAIVFRRTLLQAWQEVDNALTAYAEAQQRRTQVADAAAQNAMALQVARQRYASGVVDFLNVNSSQAQLLQSRNSLASSDTQIAANLVTLYRALGGGWEIADTTGPSRP
ncbi:MAG: efflux transporter outer membrane subunit [Janthinobacterium lividum]